MEAVIEQREQIRKFRARRRKQHQGEKAPGVIDVNTKELQFMLRQVILEKGALAGES